jgi:hypothetical protein
VAVLRTFVVGSTVGMPSGLRVTVTVIVIPIVAVTVVVVLIAGNEEEKKEEGNSIHEGASAS